MLNVILPLNSLKNVVSLYKEIIELIVFIWAHIIKGYDSYSKFLINIFFTFQCLDCIPMKKYNVLKLFSLMIPLLPLISGTLVLDHVSLWWA